MKSTHRSSKGPKLYSIRDKHNRFKDIQKYKKEHEKDQKAAQKKKDQNTETLTATSDENRKPN